MICAKPIVPHSQFLCLHPISTPPRAAVNLRRRRRRNSPVSITISAKQIVEHVVLVKVKPNTEQSQINTMVKNLSNLSSFPKVLYLTTGAVLRTQSPSSMAFTHLLHSRYSSTSDLDEYNASELHLSTVKTYLLPIIDDIMVVDWISGDDFAGNVEVPPGSVIRARFLKLKENLGEIEKSEIVGEILGMKERFEVIDQFTVGENISPARTKGFSIASIGVLRGFSDLQALDAISPPLKDSVKGGVEDVLVVDYAVPAKPPPPL